MLAQPVGERSITFVDEDVSADALREGCFDALLWDESVGEPAGLEESASGSALGFAVYPLPAQCP